MLFLLSGLILVTVSVAVRKYMTKNNFYIGAHHGQKAGQEVTERETWRQELMEDWMVAAY